MAEKRNAYKILVGNLEGRERSEDIGVGGMMVFKRILGK
jgi:hypothetical protein